jgi:hypothetical protein
MPHLRVDRHLSPASPLAPSSSFVPGTTEVRFARARNGAAAATTRASLRIALEDARPVLSDVATPAQIARAVNCAATATHG